MVLFVVYLLTPYDLIPDYLGLLGTLTRDHITQRNIITCDLMTDSRFIGYLDDAFVLLAVVWAIIALCEMYRGRLGNTRRARED